MILGIVILVISFFLDGILTNFLPYGVGDLSLFTPLITIVSLIVIYPLFYRKEDKFLITCLVTGILYDLFYTNLWFLNGVLFLFLGFVIMKLSKLIGNNFLKMLVHVLLVIIIYEVSAALLIVIFQVIPITIEKLIYKISHSLLLNLIYGEVLYIIIQLLPKKWKKKGIY